MYERHPINANSIFLSLEMSTDMGSRICLFNGCFEDMGHTIVSVCVYVCRRRLRGIGTSECVF